MIKKAKEIMNAFEKANPHHRELNDLAIEDLKSLGEVSPAKPLAIHVAYMLDGHHKNRGRYGKNYDYGLLPEDKKLVDREVTDLAELGSMLQDPDYIVEDAHGSPSESQKLAKEILNYYLEKKEAEEAYHQLEKELYRPLMENLVDRLNTQEGILDELLSPIMVKESEHLPEEYASLLKAHFLLPALKGRVEENWKSKIPKIFAALGGKSG